MNKNTILCQCNADPDVFFYYSGSNFHRRLGLYLTNNFADENVIQNWENTNKSQLSFIPVANEVSDSIFSEEINNKSVKFFPSFSWSRDTTKGAFTTGFSRNIRIFDQCRGIMRVSEIINIQNYFCTCLDLNGNGDSNILALSNIECCNLQLPSNGFVSIVDINTKQEVFNFHRSNNISKHCINGYPNNVKWVDNNCLISGWKLFDSSSQIHLHDKRTEYSLSIPNVMPNNSEFLEVSQLEYYLLVSNLNNIIKVFDIRFIKNENISNDFQPIQCINFHDNEIDDVQWFPGKQRSISISTSDGIFVVLIDDHSPLCFQNSGLGSSEHFDINWNQVFPKKFRSINIEENFNDKFCWVSSNVEQDKYSLVFTTPDTAYLLQNLNVDFNSTISWGVVNFCSRKSDIIPKSRHEVMGFPNILGYSWIPYRIIKYYKNINIRLEEYNCINLLRKLENLNSGEAQNLVVHQNDKNILTGMGVFQNSKHSLTQIIKMIKSVSYAFNYLSILPNQIMYWRELLVQLKQYGQYNETTNLLDKFILPSVSELFNVLKGGTWYSETSTPLKFIDIKLEDLECCDHMDSERKNICQIEIFHSPIREKLILFFGTSSFVVDEQTFINDPNKLELFLISFFWNCVTLQYQYFISYGDKISSILDIFIDNEYKLIKTSFLNNIQIFFNSAGILISSLYYEEINKVSISGKDIKFYYNSIISTSEHLLDEDYYLSIWNSNIYLESTIQLSIRFIVAITKFLSNQDRSQQFSSYLLEELLIPSMGISSYIYIPSSLLLLVGIYYLPLDDISNFIQILVGKMVQNGLLDGISILGFGTFTDEIYHLIRNKRDLDNSVYLGGKIGQLNYSGSKATQGSDISLSRDISSNYNSQNSLKQIFQRYLSLSFGDIQTVSLIGSCIIDISPNSNTEMELLKVCIREYRTLLNSNSLICYLIKNSNQNDLSRNAYKSKTLNGVSSLLYELNILRLRYCKIIGQDQDKFRKFVPTGNTLFCYYCEQPLFQAYFEQNFLYEKSIPNSDCNMVVSQPIKTERIDVKSEKKELINNNNRDTQTGYVFNKANKNNPAANSFIQPEICSALDLSTTIINCPNKFCRKALPKCVICLTEMPIGILNALTKDDNSHKDFNQLCSNNILGKWYTWCLHCHHGGCFKHFSEWFECFDECPVPNCNCWCNAAE
ncbi:hypothetical protein OJ253_2235 [Cryptosporidium canis]|uniref:GATOR2 complex protein MIO zinc-ribbon like domain-containing protein n=1 Tax=Cryptosporidium canis TaxID=195482 RepID=A0A9D5DIH2_9CRYT|nr:hypothetical protein OJ253_2235 [Cryptosporidium canis]